MQEYELNTIIQNIPYLSRNEKELDRYKLYVSVQANSKKKVKIEDILSLPWDAEKKTMTKITHEEQEKLRDRAKRLEQRISQVSKFEMADMQKFVENNQR